MKTTVIGMDIAKHVFQFHAVDVDTAILSASSRSETMWLTSLPEPSRSRWVFRLVRNAGERHQVASQLAG
jgi:hypothetical protein